LPMSVMDLTFQRFMVTSVSADPKKCAGSAVSEWEDGVGMRYFDSNSRAKSAPRA
jgi:hypothetical protein